jgi:hypothetical protein
VNLIDQIFSLLVLAVAVASVAWTVTQEEIFKEFRQYCAGRSRSAGSIAGRKFYYVFTCEYCFSHWVTLFFLLLSGFQLLIDDWRGYLIAFFVITWVANQFMSLYRRLRVEIKHENILAEKEEKKEKEE